MAKRISYFLKRNFCFRGEGSHQVTTGAKRLAVVGAQALTSPLRSGVVGVSDECVSKLRDLIASCRALADSMGDHPTAKALRNMAERLELNLVMAEDERGSAGNVVSVR